MIMSFSGARFKEENKVKVSLEEPSVTFEEWSVIFDILKLTKIYILIFPVGCVGLG